MSMRQSFLGEQIADGQLGLAGNKEGVHRLTCSLS